MRDLVILFIHLLTTAARLATRGGLRSVVAESVLLKHQLLILNRSRQRAPPLRLSDRLVAGGCALWMRVWSKKLTVPVLRRSISGSPLLFPRHLRAWCAYLMTDLTDGTLRRG